jgi:integrase
MRRVTDETQWKLILRANRSVYVVRYRLKKTGRWREVSTGQTRKREAEAKAKKIVAAAETDGDRDIYGWAEFRIRYEAEQLSGKAAKTLQAFQTASNRLESLCPVEFIGELTNEAFVRFAAKLRKEGKSESTIQAYRDHLLAALKWAADVDLIAAAPKPPKLTRIRRGTKSRGRPLNREEAEKIAMQLPGVVGAEYAERWAWNLEALWRSGMRLGETFLLHWHPIRGGQHIDDLDGHRPRIVIPAETEKAHTNRVVPITPGFVALLRSVPAKQRHGEVYRWPLSRGDSVSVKTVGKRISECGKRACVIVGTNDDGTPQHATAHDWRRSFGAQWAPKVMPIVLKELMRHASIETTMSYYVHSNSDRTAEALWSVQNADLGDMLDSLFGADESAYEKLQKLK